MAADTNLILMCTTFYKRRSVLKEQRPST